MRVSQMASAADEEPDHSRVNPLQPNEQQEQQFHEQNCS